MSGAGVGAECCGCFGARGGEGGCEAEEKCGEERDAEGEEQDGQIRRGSHGDVVVALAEEGDEGAGGGEGDAESEEAAGEGEEEGFDEALADDACAAGAEGEASGDFALAGGGAGEEEVGEVGAGDEKNENDDSHEDLERVAVLAAQGGDALRGGDRGTVARLISCWRAGVMAVPSVALMPARICWSSQFWLCARAALLVAASGLRRAKRCRKK